MTITRYVLIAPDGTEHPGSYDLETLDDAKEAARGIGYAVVLREYGITTSTVEALRKQIVALASEPVDDPLSPFAGEHVIVLRDVLLLLDEFEAPVSADAPDPGTQATRA